MRMQFWTWSTKPLQHCTPRSSRKTGMRPTAFLRDFPFLRIWKVHGRVSSLHIEPKSTYTMITSFFFFAECDDGERVQVTNKVYGASAVTVLRGLHKAGRLNPAEFPSLENLLKTIASFGETMESCSCSSHYAKLARAIARRLFKDKTEADLALEKARLNEWVESFEDKKERDEIKADLKEKEEEDDDGSEKSWFKKGKICDEDEKDPDWVLSRVWKEYKSHLSSVPSGPMRGPGSWDINKWSAAQKKPFEFGNDGSEDEF